MELIINDMPEVLNHPIKNIVKYDIETAHKIYNYLKTNYTNYPSINGAPSPDKYLKFAETYSVDWNVFLESVENYPEQIKKPMLENFLTFYMFYLYGLADELNYI